MVRNLSQVLTNSLSGTIVLHLSENVRPTVLKEVEGGLAVESKHGKPVGRVHSVSEKLDTMAWSGMRHYRLGLGELGDSHDTVLCTFEHTSVWLILRGNVLNKSSRTNWARPLYSTMGHGI